MKWSIFRSVLWLGSGVLLVACGAAPLAQHIDLDPIIIQADPGGGARVVGVQALFKEASEDYAAARYVDAVRRFRQLVALYGQSRYAPHARFNEGLALGRLHRWPEALKSFRAAARTLEKPRDIRDARVQVVTCLEQLGRWAALRPIAEDLVEEHRLPPVERIELMARIGVAYYRAGQLARAERSFHAVLKSYRKNAEIPRLKANPWVARSQYLVGEIYRGLFSSIKFRLPVDTMKRDLADKSAFFLKGQSAYLRAVRLSNKRWSVAAGYRLGRLYEEMYADMMHAEIPADMSDEDKGIYFQELRSQIKPLVVRAVEVYERNLGMSDRLGGGGEWAQKTQAALDRMRTILRREFTDIP